MKKYLIVKKVKNNFFYNPNMIFSEDLEIISKIEIDNLTMVPDIKDCILIDNNPYYVITRLIDLKSNEIIIFVDSEIFKY